MSSDAADRSQADAHRRWLRGAKVAVAATLFVASFWLLHTTGGSGGLATGIAVTLCVSWYFAWHRGHSYRRQLWTAARTLAVVTLLWDGASFTRYVATDNGDTVDQKMATWGRDHGLGDVINYLETIVYNDPPSRRPAEELTLATPTSAPAPPTTEAAVATTTTVPTPQAPAPLATYFDPALPGEGQWSAVASAGGQPAIWATSMRPLPEFGGVVLSMVVIDQTYVRAGMFNGSEQPGGTWTRDSKVPPELYPSLLAVMNGGFRFEHMDGGYMTEGKVVQELQQGRATLAIDRQGHISVGELGRDLFDDGSWLTLRQNLILLVDGGQPMLERGKQEHIFWGADQGNEVYVNRSAACEFADGRFAYVMAGRVDAPQLAQVLINVGCVKAIQLDINNAWPTFLLYEHGLDGSLLPHPLDKRMNINPQRYVQGSSKEFFAFFDATLVPEQSVLDA